MFKLLASRAQNYALRFDRWPASWVRLVEEQGSECIYGTWLIGNDYRNKSALYGAYPRGFLDRVRALFPDLWESRVLHAFAGSLPKGHGVRLDLNPARQPDVIGNVCALPFGRDNFDLVLADPPYSKADAVEYGTPMVDRRAAMASLSTVTRAGGFLVWLDTVWPMHRKDQWRTVGRICLIRSTNHRVRLVSIFQRVN
jgi:hypothetical protein